MPIPAIRQHVFAFTFFIIFTPIGMAVAYVILVVYLPEEHKRKYESSCLAAEGEIITNNAEVAGDVETDDSP